MAKEFKGTSWPMLVTAWLSPVLIVFTALLLSVMQREKVVTLRIQNAEVAISQQANQYKVNTDKIESFDWVGVPMTAEYGKVAVKSTPETFKGDQAKKSQAYNKYADLFEKRNDAVGKNIAFVNYVNNDFGQRIRDHIAFLALTQPYHIQSMENFVKERDHSNNAERAGTSDSKASYEVTDWVSSNSDAVNRFWAGETAESIMGGKGYIAASGQDLTLVKLLQSHIFLSRTLARRTFMANDTLAGVKPLEKAYDTAKGAFDRDQTAENIKARESVVGIDSDEVNDVTALKRAAEAESSGAAIWNGKSDSLSEDAAGSAVADAKTVQFEEVRTSIARNVRALRQSRERYVELLNGKTNPAPRMLGRHTPLDDTRAVDANIVWYDNTTNMCRINVGKDKNAHPGMRFEIWSRNDDGYYVRNGVLEVIRVLGTSYSTALVIHQDAGRLISTGHDLVNRLWEDGEYLSVGLLGELWGGEATRYSRAELLRLLQNLGVPAKNVPSVNSRIIVTGKNPEKDTKSVKYDQIRMWREQLNMVEIKEETVRIYIDPR